LFLKIRWPVIIWHFTAFRQKWFEKSVKISTNFKNIILNILIYSSKTNKRLPNSGKYYSQNFCKIVQTVTSVNFELGTVKKCANLITYCRF
jgi:hypothetical protein